jgi:cbb3-type cytochrome oxidase subunit 3
MMTTPSGSALIAEPSGAWVLVLIILVLCCVILWAPTRLARADEDARPRFLLMLIVLTFALRWASQAGTAGSASDRAACLARCSAFGGIQAAYSDADGAHCICRYP